MTKYYTKACNFYYGSISKDKVKKKLSIPLHGNKLLSFDMIEIISRKNKKYVHIKKLNELKTSIKKKFYLISNKFLKEKK